MNESVSKRPLGVTLLGAFLIVSTGILAVAAITLLHPGTFVDSIWAIKPGEYEQLLRYSPWSGIGFGVLGILMAAAAHGWFGARYWAWILVQCIFAANAGGDVARVFFGDPVGGLVGVSTVVGLLVYVRSKGVRALFAEHVQL